MNQKMKVKLAMKKNYHSIRILISESRTLSYKSAGFFLNRIGRAFEQLGVSVDYFILAEDGSNLQEMEALANRSYDAILDINSFLPRLICDDDSPFLAKMQGTFYHYIVDHPMHVKPLLELNTSLQHILCLDQSHAEYVSKVFGEAASVHVLPLAGSPAAMAQRDNRIEKRKPYIFFPGTFMPLEQYKDHLKSLGNKYAVLADTLAERSLAGEYIDTSALAWDKNVPEEACRYLDKFLRESRRQKILDELIQHNFPVALCGAHWEYSGYVDCAQEILPPCSYDNMLAKMREYRMVLNVQPLFPETPHDRVYNGMRNRAVVLSDSCGQLEREFRHGDDYILYSFATLQQDLDYLRTIWNEPDLLDAIAGNGYSKVSDSHTWIKWCETFLRITEMI